VRVLQQRKGMKTHILAGDSLVPTFQASGIEGAIIINRECLIDGPVGSKELREFWQIRADYIEATYGLGKDRYYERVAREYEKILNLSQEQDLYLWFEFDLFCQVNMWFVLSLLMRTARTNVYRVSPPVSMERHRWDGFGRLTSADFEACFDESVKFTADDLFIGARLWDAYQSGDLERLADLSHGVSACFPYLSEVCDAEIERKKNRRPEKTLRRIMQNGLTDFNEIFAKFRVEEGIYGFGDWQVWVLYERHMTDPAGSS
jgi:hypothetical protein